MGLSSSTTSWSPFSAGEGKDFVSLTHINQNSNNTYITIFSAPAEKIYINLCAAQHHLRSNIIGQRPHHLPKATSFVRAAYNNLTPFSSQSLTVSSGQ